MEVSEEEFHEFEDSENSFKQIQFSNSYSFSNVLPLTCISKSPEQLQENCSCDSDDGLSSSNHETNANSDENLSSSGQNSICSSESDMNLADQSTWNLSSEYVTHEEDSIYLAQEEETSSSSDDDSTDDSDGDHQEDYRDEFYNIYSERMRWFDVLNWERTCGSRSILSNKMDRSLNLWWQMVEKKLLKSIERDLELVYVAQACLSWEALLYNYTKLRELRVSGLKLRFRDDIFGEFQKFQVLLERFMEDERCEDNKRALRFVKARFGLNGLLQVPKLSGN